MFAQNLKLIRGFQPPFRPPSERIKEYETLNKNSIIKRSMTNFQANHFFWMPDHVQYMFYQGDIFYVPERKVAVAILSKKCFGEYMINVRNLSGSENPANKTYLNALEEATSKRHTPVSSGKDRIEFMRPITISEEELGILTNSSSKKEELTKIIERLHKF